MHCFTIHNIDGKVMEKAVQLTHSDLIALAGVAATLIAAVISWFSSAYVAKKAMRKEELSYWMRITPLMNKKLFRDADKLEIQYKGDVIDELVLLEIDIINSGNVAIKNPPIKITSENGT